MLDIKSTKKESELTYELTGRLDTSTAPDLDAKIKEEAVGIDSLIIDFKGLEYISSAGLRVVLAALKMMKDGRMVIRNVNDEIMEIFEMTGFSDILTIE